MTDPFKVGDEEVPAADWACKEAFKRAGVLHGGPAWEYMSVWSRELARMIEKHEEPPVDPALIAARECYASRLPRYASYIREGKYDTGAVITIFLAGVKWAREDKDET